MHTRETPRFRSVDGNNAGTRVGTSEAATYQHSRKRDVRSVPRPSSNLGNPVNALRCHSTVCAPNIISNHWSPPAHTRARFQRQVPSRPDSEIAVDRGPLLFHE